MKDPADDIGDQILDQMILVAKRADKNLAANNRAGLLKDMDDIEKLTMKILPHIGNKQLQHTFAARVAKLIPVIRKVENGGPLSLITDHFAQSASSFESVKY